MNRRNWEYLSRKLVDATDLDYSFNAVQIFMSQNNLAFFGEGVLTTTTYPVPFPISISGLSGTVGKGIAYDPTGLQTRIDDTLGAFTVPTPDATLPRADLLVLRYLAVGDTQIPEPSLPTSNVYLNIHDGYQLAVIPGTPAANAVYPAKGQYDIILAGLNVAPGSSTASIDLSIREVATPLRAFFPTFKQETLTGAGGVYTLSATPYNASSLLVSVDGVAIPSSGYSLSGKTLTITDTPAPGQFVSVWYVVNSAGSVNPVAGMQEVPSGVVDGSNNTFSLSAEPVDQNSTKVYIDGLIVPVSGWSLVQSPTMSKIIFNAGWIPQPGQDVYAFYLRNVVAASAQQSSSSGGGGGGGTFALMTDYPQLSGSDITNGYVTLSHNPATPSAVLFDIIGGGAQAYNDDFTVNGNKLTWSASLGNTLAAGDKFRVHYAY